MATVDGTPPEGSSTNGQIAATQRKFALLLASPALIGLTVFLILPFLLALGLTFTDQRLLSPNETEFVGLRNYSRLLSVTVLTQDPLEDGGKVVRTDSGAPRYQRVREITRHTPRYEGFRPLTAFHIGDTRVHILAKDPTFIRSLLNTFLFSFMVVPLQCALALGMALLVDQQVRGRNIFRTIYFAPVVVSMVVVSILWVMLYNKDVGLVNKAFSVISLGLFDPVDWLGNPVTALPAIAIMSAWQGAGFQMVVFLAGLQGISPTLYEAADVDGANSWQKFRHVTLPGLRNTIIFVVISTSIAAFGLFTQVDVMTSGGPGDSTSTVMYHAIRTGVREQDIAYGSTVSVIYFALITVIAITQKRLFASGDA